MKINNLIKKTNAGRNVGAMAIFTALALTTLTPTGAVAASGPITVYQHCNYGGYAVSLRPGAYDMHALTRRGIRNDDLSALRVPRGYKVTAYEHAGFRGRAKVFTSSNSCLVNSGFNDVISSIRIEKLRIINQRDLRAQEQARREAQARREQARREAQARARRLEQARLEAQARADAKARNRRSHVTVYQHCNFGGYAVPLHIGSYDMHSLARRGIRNDDLSALRVPRGYKVTAYEHAGFRGRAKVFTSSNSCLVNSGFNDVISSIRIEKLRRHDHRAHDEEVRRQEQARLEAQARARRLEQARRDQARREQARLEAQARARRLEQARREAQARADAKARNRRSHVTVYQHCNYGGYAVPLRIGSYDMHSLARRGIRNDDLSALRVPRGYKVTAYEHAGFRGRAKVFTSSNSCLVNSGFNDVISSIRVEKLRRHDHRAHDEEVRRQEQARLEAQARARRLEQARRDQARREQARLEAQARARRLEQARREAQARADAKARNRRSHVTVYQHCNYGGYAVPLRPGAYDMKTLNRRGIRNDDLSALRVPRGLKVTIYEHAGFRGRSQVLTASNSCLVNTGFNDKVSSIKVQRIR